jgi:hypothetical protein
LKDFSFCHSLSRLREKGAGLQTKAQASAVSISGKRVASVDLAVPGRARR